jgi:hypothetical protein
MRIWDLMTHAMRRTTFIRSAFIFSPDCQTLAIGRRQSSEPEHVIFTSRDPSQH